MSELIVPKNSKPVDSGWGAPLEPVGNPLSAGIGPGAWADRADRPDLTIKGAHRIVPIRVATDFEVAHEDPDPRGHDVKGMDGVVGGKVVDLWVDRSEPCLRYLEMEIPGGARKLIPVPFMRMPRPSSWIPFVSVGPSATHVQIDVLKAADFAGIPDLRNPDSVTLLEEDKISAYYGAGSMYNSTFRFGPLI